MFSLKPGVHLDFMLYHIKKYIEGAAPGMGPWLRGGQAGAAAEAGGRLQIRKVLATEASAFRYAFTPRILKLKGLHAVVDLPETV